ncbi:molecular chaperone TorD family protein [Bacillus shivajii]|uniref:molecular chaperone TorD family protein n=1 Tax=Bacillus shivajii TaxID=1983719 RepID=UPI001CFA9C2D|nr:molecular chaperone TorD family protein [Bacillus shivajii]UCZ52458.1 molecular chaperone TorD family protein [Bacillus shivajii]
MNHEVTDRTFSIEEESYMFLLFAHFFYGNFDHVKELLNRDLPSIILEEIGPIITKSKNTSDEEFKVQYENLFYIPGPHYVPPYVASHLHDKHDDQSETAFLETLAKRYEKEGFLPFAEEKFLRIDHLGTLFMFQHFLLMKQMETEDNIHSKNSTNIFQEYVVPSYGTFEKKVSEQLEFGICLDFVQQIHKMMDIENQ